MKQTESTRAMAVLRHLVRPIGSIGAAVAVALATLGPAAAAEASAVMVCGLRTAITSELHDDYAEQPAALGVTNSGHVMELWTSAAENTWTLIMTLADGTSCIVGAGGDWRTIERTASGELL